MSKIRFAVAGFLMMVIAGVVAGAPSLYAGGTGDTYDGNGNSLDLSRLEVGDIILTRGVLKVIGGLDPGYWDHCAIYIGNGQIVESYDAGVRVKPANISLTADEAAIYRVRTTSAVKQAAVNFCNSQIGKPYDFGCILWPGTKDINSSSWYCSELVWAGYKRQGVDIDRNPGYHWLYWNNVSPTEISEDSDTFLVTSSQ